MDINRQNITSASETSIGFDYQFYYFFYKILFLRHGEKIGLEVKDDVHLSLADGKTILIQTKHSIQTNASGNIINLTERDKDLWKTLSNWTKLLKEQSNPTEYLENTFFQLVTNKNNLGNTFIQNIKRIQNSELSISDFKLYLKNLIDTTTDANILSFMNEFYSIGNKILSSFINNIMFELNEDNLIERIKERLLEHIHIPERVNDVYASLHSALRDSNYLTVKDKENIEISFEDFNMKFRNCFKVGLNTKLPIRDVEISIPTNPTNQLFIKQLIDIGDISANDKDEIIEYTTQMLKLYNNLKEWEKYGDLLPSERKKFDKNSITIWKNSFRSKFRKVKEMINSGTQIGHIEDEIRNVALDCLDDMRKQILAIDETLLDAELSNGHFYLLTNEKNIGWHFDWENRYKK